MRPTLNLSRSASVDVAEVVHQGAAPSMHAAKGLGFVVVTYRPRQVQPPIAVPFGSNQMFQKHTIRRRRARCLAESGGSRAPGFPRSGSAVNQGNFPFPTRGGQNYGAHA